MGCQHMSLYYISEKSGDTYDAGSKARDDVSYILSRKHWNPCYVSRTWGASTFAEKIRASAICLYEWNGISRGLHYGDVLLLQYPLSVNPQVARAALRSIRKMHRCGVKLIYLIHDLDSLRGMSRSLEHQFLNLADVAIAHNRTMSSYLEDSYKTIKTVSLEIFDYILPEQTELYDGVRDGIDVAGNLSYEKAGYLYDDGLRALSPPLSLYGPNYEQGRGGGLYKGCFPSERLPSILAGKFGLVWDGKSSETCTGLSGEYLKINNPHKLSLYLACGTPVFIWNQAAEAVFVRANDVGAAVSNIPEALELYRTISPERYDELKRNARIVGEKVRSGFYTSKAVDRALDLIQ